MIRRAWAFILKGLGAYGLARAGISVPRTDRDD